MYQEFDNEEEAIVFYELCKKRGLKVHLSIECEDYNEFSKKSRFVYLVYYAGVDNGNL